MNDIEMKKEHITTITELLALYYDGDASPEQISELIRLFSEPGDLPAKLEDERRVFMVLEGDTRLEAESVQVPADLEQRLSDAIDGFEKEELAEIGIKAPRRSSREFIRRIAIGTAAAAIVMVTLTLGWKAMNIVSNTPDLNFGEPKEQAVAATDTTVPETHESLAASSEAQGPENTMTDDTEAEKPMKPVTPGGKSSGYVNPGTMAYSPVKEHKPKANIRVITDPEEARMLLDRVQTKIRKNINEAEMAGVKTENIIESINRSINTDDL